MTTAILAVAEMQAKRQRRARLLARAADRAQNIGLHHSVKRALVPLHNSGDALSAFDRNLSRNMHANDAAFRAFALARKFRNEAMSLLGAA